ncbi:MAG TPA: SDR family NAD(P)-dependent oxidoreductase [Bryobacteraceae bacterium]
MNTDSFLLLRDQVAVVTGAATGIGAAIAQRLASAQATVAVADLNAEAAAQAANLIRTRTNGAAFPFGVDVTNPLSIEQAIQDLLKRFGRIDILINNAGIAGRAAPLWEQNLDEWRQVIEVNLFGIVHCCRAVIEAMRRARYGRIVNIASIAGKEGNPNMTAYSASKAAVIGFTKSLAKEVATEGICVNAVSPAVVRTRILEQLTPAQIDYMTEKIPMRRTGSPEEIAAVVHFLASKDCSFVTGQCYDASGGRATY